MGIVYDKAVEFKKKYPGGIYFRYKQHCDVVEHHLNPGEEVLFVFMGQKNDKFYDIFTSCCVAVTNKRILIGQKRVVWGYFLISITPDLYNDLSVYRGLLFGKVVIDTVKEVTTISDLPRSSLNAIETSITEMMMNKKQFYKKPEEHY